MTFSTGDISVAAALKGKQRFIEIARELKQVLRLMFFRLNLEGGPPKCNNFIVDAIAAGVMRLTKDYK